LNCGIDGDEERNDDEKVKDGGRVDDDKKLNDGENSGISDLYIGHIQASITQRNKRYASCVCWSLPESRRMGIRRKAWISFGVRINHHTFFAHLYF
jgi:hypothetical protein